MKVIVRYLFVLCLVMHQVTLDAGLQNVLGGSTQLWLDFVGQGKISEKVDFVIDQEFVIDQIVGDYIGMNIETGFLARQTPHYRVGFEIYAAFGKVGHAEWIKEITPEFVVINDFKIGSHPASLKSVIMYRSVDAQRNRGAARMALTLDVINGHHINAYLYTSPYFNYNGAHTIDEVRVGVGLYTRPTKNFRIDLYYLLDLFKSREPVKSNWRGINVLGLELSTTF